MTMVTSRRDPRLSSKLETLVVEVRRFYWTVPFLKTKGSRELGRLRDGGLDLQLDLTDDERIQCMFWNDKNYERGHVYLT